MKEGFNMDKNKKIICDERKIDFNLFNLSFHLNALMNTIPLKDKHIINLLHDLISYVDDKLYACPEGFALMTVEISIVSTYEREDD